MKLLCIYHADCPDGFAAAWAAREALGAVDVEYFPGAYQSSQPDVTGRDVILVDFSYRRAVIEEMANKARSILILDHHKTAVEDLSAIVRPVPEGRYDPDALRQQAEDDGVLPIYALFDLERSGAGISWDYFHAGTQRPALIDHVEDADLNRLQLEGTEEIMATALSYPWDFEIWGDLMRTPVKWLRDEGVAILRKHRRDVARLVDLCRRRMTIASYEVPVANAPRPVAHDAAHMMAGGEPFAAAYFDCEAGRVFSLRSAADGIDVSEIAKQFGGGGHKHAAGFTVPLGWEGEQRPASSSSRAA